MFCHFHKKRLAIYTCQNCGVPLCQDCRFLVKGQILCKKCSTIDIPEFFIIPQRRPVIAAILSFFMPGAGQIYNGQAGKGVGILLTSWLVIPWLFGVFDAYGTARRINREGFASPPSLLAFFIFIFFVLSIYLSIFLVVQYFFELNYPAVEAQRNLKKLSVALEAYKRDYGVYPESYMQMYDADPRYIDELYCDVEFSKYRYSCIFTPEGYELKADPVAEGEDKALKHFMVKTQGVWSSQESVKEPPQDIPKE